jgi:HEAT repeat protein
MDPLITRRRLLSSLTAAAVPLVVPETVLGQVPGQPGQPQPPAPAQLLTSSSLVGGKTLDQWIEDLKDKDPSVRETAMATLRMYGPVARPAVPALIKACQDGDASLRVNAVIALGMIGMDNQDISGGVAALGKLLNDQQAIVRFQAATALGRLGVDGRPAVPTLVNYTLKDRQAWEIRRAAANALGSVAEDQQNGPDMRAVKGLADALSDVCFMVRLEAVFALIVLGPPLAPADRLAVQRTLATMLKNERNRVVQIWTRVALMRMEKPSDEHLTAIGKYLKSPDAQARSHAARALGVVGKESKKQVGDVVDALQREEDPVGMFWMIKSLGQIGEGAQTAVPLLTKFSVQHKDETIRRAATESLQQIQGQAPPKK